MNKLLFLFICFFCFTIQAQDSLAVAKKNVAPYTESNIKVDDSAITISKFSSNFKSKYQTSDFQYEIKISEKGFWDRFMEWLRFMFKEIFGLSNMETSGKYVDLTLKIIAILIVTYAIYIIVKLILNKEGKWIFGKSTTAKVFTSEEIERNLKIVDFEKLIRETIKVGNNRLAIRYYYLWLLKKMTEKNVIDWNPEKTNSDYFYEIKDEKLKADFGYVSYLYNYIWYGEFELDEITFEKAQQTFEKTLESIR